MTEFISVILPIAIGALVTWGYDYVQKAIALLEKIPSSFKPVVVAALAYGTMTLAQTIGLELGVYDPTVWGEGDWAQFLTATMSYIFKLGKGQKEAAVALKQ